MFLQPFSLSFLPVKEDHVTDAMRTARAVGWLTPAGLLLAVVGVAAQLFLEGFPAAAGVGLWLLGLLLTIYDLLLSPQLARLNAMAQFEQQETLRQAVAVTFDTESLSVETARVSGTLPYSLLTAATETPTLFVFTFGAELTLRVPRRLLNEQQTAALRGLCVR